MASADLLDVLVVGAGPTGLTLATALARAGVRCRIIDAAPQPAAESRALAIHAGTLQAMERLGLAEAILARGIAAPGVKIHVDGANLDIPFDRLPSRYAFILTLPQSDTEGLLIGRLTAAGVVVERPVSFVDLLDDGDAVTATLRIGDRQERVRARWLVACDGAGSRVRHVLGLPFVGRAYDETFWLADVRVRWPYASDVLHIFLGAHGLLFTAPLPGERQRIIVTPRQTAAVQSRGEGLRLADVQALVDEAAPGTRLDDPAWLSTFHVSRRVVPRFRVGRVFLAGDAAHVHSPAGGQGMNTGIQDAENLAWKLALVVRGAADPSLLDSYHAERYPVARGVVRVTDRLTRAALLHAPLLRAARNLVMRVLLRRPSVQRRIALRLSELAIAYRDSPVILPARGRAVRHGIAPGRRFPDVTVRAGDTRTRLFEMVGSDQHTVLILTGTADVAAATRLATELCERYPRRLQAYVVRSGGAAPHAASDSNVLDDADGRLARTGGDVLYIVRPDGYVGARAAPPSARVVADYFARLATPARGVSLRARRLGRIAVATAVVALTAVVVARRRRALGRVVP
jgi:2-polyprenyl-6-methoxyphenol hydroxylase-like FAD-dependent oxidoreductase